MTVWLDDESCHALDCCLHGTCEDHEGDTYRVGPYVHLDQFLEEVENRVCRRKSPPSLSTHEAVAVALYELAKEIAEGKA